MVLCFSLALAWNIKRVTFSAMHNIRIAHLFFVGLCVLLLPFQLNTIKQQSTTRSTLVSLSQMFCFFFLISIFVQYFIYLGAGHMKCNFNSLLFMFCSVENIIFVLIDYHVLYVFDTWCLIFRIGGIELHTKQMVFIQNDAHISSYLKSMQFYFFSIIFFLLSICSFRIRFFCYHFRIQLIYFTIWLSSLRYDTYSGTLCIIHIGLDTLIYNIPFCIWVH